MPHTSSARRADPERHHHHGEHGKSWPLDRKSPRLFPRDISLVQEAPSTPLTTPAPSRKRKRCQSPPPNHLSKPINSADGPRSPKHRATVAERKPLGDAQNLAVVVQAPLVLNTSNPGLESLNHNAKMSYPHSSAAGAYATATSYRQCVQRFADRHHYTMYTTYHGAGPSHARIWRAQITLTRRVRTGHEVIVIDHTSTCWYTKQTDAKEAASAEVWTMLVGRGWI